MIFTIKDKMLSVLFKAIVFLAKLKVELFKKKIN